MSVWGIGTSSNETESAAIAVDPPNTATLITNALAAFVKWIPAEVVAGYGAFVAVNWAKQAADFTKTPPGPKPAPVSSLWFVALIATPLLILLACLVSSNWERAVRKVVLAPVGFLLWSASVPNSYWNKFSWFEGNEATAIGLVVLLGGGAIAGLGEWILSRTLKDSEGNAFTDWRKYV